MATLFTKIIQGEIPGQVVWSDDVCAAFLDVSPLTRGHALVVPLEEVDRWTDLDGATMAHLMDVAARIGRAQLEVFGGQRAGVIIQGFEVPYAHVHVFPASSPADFDLSSTLSPSADDLAEDADLLRGALGR
jgi:histidine triad (HIT) family protein